MAGLCQLTHIWIHKPVRIPELPQIVTSRNQLIHGYATVRSLTIWNVAQSSLPALLVCVNGLLEELGEG